MANTNAPYGARLIDDEGKQFRVRRYVKKTGSAIYQGDFVIQNSTGDVAVATAGSKLLGVAMEYKAATDVSDIAICDDPEAVWSIQASANLAAADVFQNADFVATTGSTTLFTSKHAVDSAALSSVDTVPLKIIGLDSIASNAYGSYARIKVKINHHVFKNGTSGV